MREFAAAGAKGEASPSMRVRFSKLPQKKGVLRK
jgi:hypothetical protein